MYTIKKNERGYIYMHFIIIFFWRKCVIFLGREKSNKVEKEKIEMAVVYHKYIVHNYFTVYLWIFV